MITVRTPTSNSAGSGTAASVSRPTGTTTGDVVLIVVHANNQTTISDNNGSTPFTADVSNYQPNPAYGHTVSVFTRRIQAGDPSTYNFTLGTSGRWSVTCYAMSNVDAGTIYDVSPSTFGQASDSTTVDAPSITTLTDNALHIVVGCLDDGTVTVTGFPSGYTNTVSQNNQPLGMASKLITPAGATGPQTFTFSGASARISISMAIKPAASTQLQDLIMAGIIPFPR